MKFTVKTWWFPLALMTCASLMFVPSIAVTTTNDYNPNDVSTQIYNNSNDVSGNKLNSSDVNHDRVKLEGTTNRRAIFDDATIDLVTDMNGIRVGISANQNGKEAVVDANNYIEKVSTPITTIVGVVANTATLAALNGRPFSAIPSSYFLSSLAVADTLTLITVQFNKKFVISLIGNDVRSITSDGCKIFFFVVHFSKILSAWFVVLVCIERFIVICFPFRAKQICTKTNALKGIAIVVTTAIFYSGIWTLSSDISDSQCNPSYSTPETKLQAKLIIIIGSALIGIFPMVILIGLTPVMCIMLFRYRNVSKYISSSRGQDVTKISFMLITLCVTYVLLQLPLIVAHNMASNRGENVYTTTYLPLVILYKVGNVLESINYSCNFFLYIGCNRMFREKIFSFCKTRNVSEITQQTTEIPIPVLSVVA